MTSVSSLLGPSAAGQDGRTLNHPEFLQGGPMILVFGHAVCVAALPFGLWRHCGRTLPRTIWQFLIFSCHWGSQSLLLKPLVRLGLIVH